MTCTHHNCAMMSVCFVNLEEQEDTNENQCNIARLPVSVPFPRFHVVSTDSSCHKMSINCWQITLILYDQVCILGVIWFVRLLQCVLFTVRKLKYFLSQKKKTFLSLMPRYCSMYRWIDRKWWWGL